MVFAVVELGALLTGDVTFPLAEDGLLVVGGNFHPAHFHRAMGRDYFSVTQCIVPEGSLHVGGSDGTDGYLIDDCDVLVGLTGDGHFVAIDGD